jgi:hypothetical protein
MTTLRQGLPYGHDVDRLNPTAQGKADKIHPAHPGEILLEEFLQSAA